MFQKLSYNRQNVKILKFYEDFLVGDKIISLAGESMKDFRMRLMDLLQICQKINKLPVITCHVQEEIQSTLQKIFISRPAV